METEKKLPEITNKDFIKTVLHLKCFSIMLSERILSDKTPLIDNPDHTMMLQNELLVTKLEEHVIQLDLTGEEMLLLATVDTALLQRITLIKERLINEGEENEES